MAKKKVSVKKAIKSMTVADIRKQFEAEIEKGRKTVEREATRIKKSIDSSVKQADAYIRKNPEKAAAIAAGVAAALGAAAALISSNIRKGKK